MSLKNPKIPAGIKPATFRFVAQRLNHSATAVPSHYNLVHIYIYIYTSKNLASYKRNVFSTQHSYLFRSMLDKTYSKICHVIKVLDQSSEKTVGTVRYLLLFYLKF